MLAATKINQWKNTSSTLKWFNNIDRKKICSFIKFDIENFYPSISITLFNKAIEFAKKTCVISNDNSSIIMQAHKTLLFHEQTPWIKKTGNENFDVSMGCFFGAEVCKLVGSYILSKLAVMIKREYIRL